MGMVGGMLPTGPLFFPPSPSSNSTYSSNVAFLDGHLAHNNLYSNEFYAGGQRMNAYQFSEQSGEILQNETSKFDTKVPKHIMRATNS
jgi:prepilin-type processing-associated H-X9-DG protein